jgi:LysR family nitrogen assimilation transcriptional regulator
MVELRTLAYFVTTCRAASLALAAEELGIAASTLSTTMKTLERDLGLELFRRINNGLYPTEAARMLMRAADPLLMAELFARRWAASSSKLQLKVLKVDIGISFTIGGLSKALRHAIAAMGASHPNILVDPLWTDEKDIPQIPTLTDDRHEYERVNLTIGLGNENHKESRRAVTLVTEPWAYACRLPQRTRQLPSAAELAAGRLVIPLLSPPLIEQADRFITHHKISGVRFLNYHPGDLARLMDDYPDAALFVPQGLISPRLGLANVAAIPPGEPLATNIVAWTANPNVVTATFTQHLKAALAGEYHSPIERPKISFRQIHYFNMVHRLRRVSAAARGASISQPSLSEQIHRLEASLGGPLFERHDDGIVPTAKAIRFAPLARLIEAGFRRLRAQDDSAAPPQSRRISVGILPSVNQHGFLVNRIAEAMLDIQARHPGLKLVIREAPNGTLQDWVIRGLVGVAVVETALPHMPRMPLGSSESLAAVAHARHRLLPNGPVTLTDLVRLNLALPTNWSGLRQMLDTAAEERGLKIQPYMEIDAFPMAVAILARLPVCTVLPSSAVEREIAAGDLIAHPIVDPVISRRLFVIYSGERSLSEPERNLVNSLRRKLSEPRSGD